MREAHSQRSSANCIGIHLGLSNTLVARFNEKGEPEITTNSELECITPSVVWIEDSGEVIVGKEAKKMLGIVINVFAEFMRVIGEPGKSWQIGGKEITPADLSALFLKKVVQDYEAQFGKPDTIAITWPASFRNEQREAMKEAAAMAGLKNVFFIEEPVAAALFYSTQHTLNGKYLVYDFGSGTFDVSLLEAKDKEIKILYHEGVQELGGKDLDEKLIGLIGQKYTKMTGNPLNPNETMGELLLSRWDVEQLKITLSTREKVSVPLRTDRGILRAEITREEFESAISSLISQAEMACEQVLKCGQTDPSEYVKKSEVLEIFMTSGTSRVPAIQKSLERLFGKPPKVIEPDAAVALGAAIHAAHMTAIHQLTPMQKFAVGGLAALHRAPHFLGVVHTNWLTGEETNFTIIRKNEDLPVRRSFTIKTDERGYIPVLKITQSAIEEQNPVYVSVLVSADFPRCEPNTEVELIIGCEIDGTLSVFITEVATGKSITYSFR